MNAVHRPGLLRPLVLPGLVILGLGLAGVAQHEMWRDELRAWLIAREHSHDLLSFLRYEGHPPLWYLMLVPLVQLGADIHAMQVLHVIIGTAGTLLLLRSAPLPAYQRWFYALGYYPLFEYFIVSRSYALIQLFLFAFCRLHRSMPRNHLAIGLVLAALSMTHLLGVILAAPLAAFVFFDRSRVNGGAEARGSPFLPALLAGVAAAAAVLMLIPPADSMEFAREVNTRSDVWFVLRHGGSLARAYVPIDSGVVFWAVSSETPFDHPLVAALLEPRLYAVLSAPLLLGAIWLFKPRPRVLLLFLAATLSLWAFLTLKNLHFARHVGILHLVLVVCLWLAPPGDRARSRAAGALLAVHLLGGAGCYVWDLGYTYSGAEALARHMRERGLDRLPIVAGGPRSGEALSALLDRPIDQPDAAVPGTVYRLDDEDRGGPPERAYVTAWKLAKARRSEVVLVLNLELEPRPGLKPLGIFSSSWSRSKETFHLYTVSP